MVHLTEKPVELAARAIEYSSLPGENVLDPFAGSGSTLVACEQTGRRACGWRSIRFTPTWWSPASARSVQRDAQAERVPASPEAVA